MFFQCEGGGTRAHLCVFVPDFFSACLFVTLFHVGETAAFIRLHDKHILSLVLRGVKNTVKRFHFLYVSE